MTDLATLNEDWIKTTAWDLPTTLSGLLFAIGVMNKPHDVQIAALDHLVTLPCWLAAPDTLKTQVHGLVALHVPNQRFRVKRYNEDQPRDSDGRFGSGDTLDTSHLVGGTHEGPISKETAEANLQGFLDRGLKAPTAAADAAWYVTRHDEVVGWAHDAGVSVPVYTAALASTSPLCPWQSKSGILMNKNLADKAIAMALANPGVDPKAYAKSLDSPGMLKTSLAHAVMSVQGNASEALQSPKVRSFNNNITDPNGRDVTMDTWLARAISGNPNLDEGKMLKSLVGGGTTSKLDSARYGWSADIIRKIADQQDPPMTPNAVQAVIWGQVKRESTLGGGAG